MCRARLTHPDSKPHEIDGTADDVWVHLITRHGIHPHALHIPDAELTFEHRLLHWVAE